MVHQLRGRLAVGLIAVMCLSAPAAAQAEDFLSALFAAFGGGRPSAPPPIQMPFANEGVPQDFPPRAEVPRARVSYGGGQAWCVRSCDGRYFPLSASGDQSPAATCHSFCPASETMLVHGSSIDGAATETGKPYSELPNAFRYRNELVAGCTCNGRDPIGLAPIKIEDDPTIRKGDIVAGADGLMVANRSTGRHAALNFSPASSELRARYRSVPVVAAE
jgi:hypothetical protein